MATKTASDRAKELNAETNARAQAEGWQAWSTLVEDPEHWAEYGVHTADELDHYLLAADYWDYYKEVHGIRPRWSNPWEWTDDELREALEGLREEAREQADDYFWASREYEEPEPPETAEEREAREERENAEGYAPDTAPLTHNPFANLTL